MTYGTVFSTILVMGDWSSTVEEMRGNPKNVRFSTLCNLLERIGYVLKRQRGSHMIYSRPGFPLVNVQGFSGKAKAYQVKQVLKIIDDNKIEVK